MSLKGKVAIVTGGGGAIGRATSLKLAAAGCAIAVADIRLDAAEETARLVKEGSGQALPIATDVGEPEQVERMVRETIAAFKRVDVMVNNAGASEPSLFLDVPIEGFEKIMRINVTAALLAAQLAARDMVTRKWGRIVNIASISGQRAGWARTSYGTSKGALIHLTRQMAMELAPLGITANAVAPGPVDTALSRRNHTPETRRSYLRAIPAKRYGLPEEIAGAVAYLASEDAGFVNGHCLNVDGGYIAGGITSDDS